MLGWREPIRECDPRYDSDYERAYRFFKFVEDQHKREAEEAAKKKKIEPWQQRKWNTLDVILILIGTSWLTGPIGHILITKAGLAYLEAMRELLTK